MVRYETCADLNADEEIQSFDSGVLEKGCI